MDSDHWQQHNVTFTDRETRTRAITERLGPALLAAEDAGQIDGWWFMNKQPWPLRYRAPQASPLVQSALNDLVDDGTAKTWLPGIYEPESAAFGGTLSMEGAHDLFHQDSRHLLTYQQSSGPGPGQLGGREITVLLLSTLMRAANLDWFEQGDVWAKAAALRPPPTALNPDRATALITAMRRLMTVDTHSLHGPEGPLDGHAEWLSAFERTGTTLAYLNTTGRLTRGVRAVIAHHVIFHANRAGIAPDEQSVLFTIAREAVMGSDDNIASSTEGTPETAEVVDLLRHPERKCLRCATAAPRPPPPRPACIPPAVSARHDQPPTHRWRRRRAVRARSPTRAAAADLRIARGLIYDRVPPTRARPVCDPQVAQAMTSLACPRASAASSRSVTSVAYCDLGVRETGSYPDAPGSC